MHYIYIDDSGNETNGIFSALALPCETWKECFGRIKTYRHELKQSYGIYVHKEIHALEFCGGRGRISSEIVTKYMRCEIFKQLLSLTADLPGAILYNAVFHKKNEYVAFERLMNRINVGMEKLGSHASLICDEGKEAAYTKLVRRMAVHNYIPSRYGRWAETGTWSKNIPTHYIIEDPVFKNSKRSFFVQLVDCCAYALLRKEFPLASKTKYGLDKAFDLLNPICETRANKWDKLGIIRV